jgi:hypothetical protein
MKMPCLFLLIWISIIITACNQNKGSHLAAVEVNNSDSDSKTDSMKLKITIGQKIVRASLYDNPTAREFTSLLPLTLTLTDYNATEKISDLTKKLSAKDAPAGYKPSVGDITLYAPWGNLAIFYKDFSYSNGLISLGKVTSGIEAINVRGPLKAKFELDNN